MVAPAGTPPEIVDKLNAAFREALNDRRRRAQRLDMLGAEIKIDTPEDFGKMIASQSCALLDTGVVDRPPRRSQEGAN